MMKIAATASAIACATTLARQRQAVGLPQFQLTTDRMVGP
jgi:hypothetical protein